MDRIKKLFLLFLAGMILLPLALIFVSSFMENNEAVLTYGGVLEGKIGRAHV